MPKLGGGQTCRRRQHQQLLRFLSPLWVVHPLGRRLFILPTGLSVKGVRSGSTQSPREPSQLTALQLSGPVTPSHRTSRPACERKRDLSQPVPAGTLGACSVCSLTPRQSKGSQGKRAQADHKMQRERFSSADSPRGRPGNTSVVPTAPAKRGWRPAACRLQAKRQEASGCPQAPFPHPVGPFPSSKRRSSGFPAERQHRGLWQYHPDSFIGSTCSL